VRLLLRPLLACVVASLVVVLGLPAPAAGEGGYSAPVDASVVDAFRPPPTPYGPGNRGIDYGTSPGDVVRAAGAGEVVFAGPVGLSRHVVLLHPDGLRTSYSFLASVSVRRGDEVLRGDPVGVAAARLHFGVRAGDDLYLDPSLLLDGRPPPVHLVPVESRRVGSERTERFALLRSLVGVPIRAGTAAVAWAAETAVDVGREELEGLLRTLDLAQYYANVPRRLGQLTLRAWSVWRDQQGCTPGSEPPPPPPAERRIAVLVGGFGSASGHAAILDVDTGALGYDPGDVAQFSYRGGQAPGKRRIAGIETTTYDHTDSVGDIAAAGARLRSMLHDVAARHPGVPIDLIAHSQGGLVVRSALGSGRAPPVDHVVTLGTPHHGADMATTNQALAGSLPGQALQWVVGTATGGHTDPDSVAAGQLSERSRFIADLPGLPSTVRATSVAAAGDLVVPALNSQLDGAANTIVPLRGVSAHDRLPGSPQAARELALALGGRRPTCRNLLDDLFEAAAVSVGEDGIGALATIADVAEMGRFRLPR
jgi:hypothetical protein